MGEEGDEKLTAEKSGAARAKAVIKVTFTPSPPLVRRAYEGS